MTRIGFQYPTTSQIPVLVRDVFNPLDFSKGKSGLREQIRLYSHPWSFAARLFAFPRFPRGPLLPSEGADGVRSGLARPRVYRGQRPDRSTPERGARRINLSVGGSELGSARGKQPPSSNHPRE
jgi:hypothetical protein